MISNLFNTIYIFRGTSKVKNVSKNILAKLSKYNALTYKDVAQKSNVAPIVKVNDYNNQMPVVPFVDNERTRCNQQQDSSLKILS